MKPDRLDWFAYTVVFCLGIVVGIFWGVWLESKFAQPRFPLWGCATIVRDGQEKRIRAMVTPGTGQVIGLIEPMPCQPGDPDVDWTGTGKQR